MTETEKTRIKPLEAYCDYDLWRIRIDAIVDDKGLTDVSVSQDEASESSAAATSSDRTDVDRRKKAKAIIVTALGDTALRVVRGVINNPALMFANIR